MENFETYRNKFHLNDLSKYTILITGGAGFIGSNLVEYLMKHSQCNVKVLDNLSTGKIENISKYLDYKNFEFVNGDIRDFNICKKTMENVNYVFHQAALGSVPRSISDPITTNDVNISGFLNILVAAKENPILKKIIYAASSSTYGDHLTLPKIEQNIGKPLSPYAVTKYVNELYADVFSKTYGLKLIGLRYFNVFGPKQNPFGEYAAVIPKFTTEIINGNKIKINGDGSNTRDFTYIENVVKMNILALENNTESANNQVYNTACGEEISLNNLVKHIEDNLSLILNKNFKADIEYGEKRVGDVIRSKANIEKAFQLLNYKPEVYFLEGISNYLKWKCFINEKI